MYALLISFMIVSACWCGLSSQRNRKIEIKGKDGFVVTWGSPEDPNPNPYAFSRLPRTEAETINNTDWKLLDDGCKDKNLHYLGRRYIWKDDVSAFIIYDVQGNVAGIQAVIRKDLADENGAVDYSNHPTTYLETIRGVEVYRFTVYFTDPKTICRRGRSHLQFIRDGTIGTLYLQNGSDPVANSVSTPKTEDERALRSLRWVKGKCVPTMGMHYYYDVSDYQDCATMFPYFLMYDVNGKMSGFGFFPIGDYRTMRYEYVPNNTLSMFVDPVPRCLYRVYDNGGAITAFHVFVEPEPKTITCE